MSRAQNLPASVEKLTLRPSGLTALRSVGRSALVPDLPSREVGARGVGAGPRAWESWSPTLPLPPGAPREPRPRLPSDAGLTKGNVLTGSFPAQTVAILISRTTVRGMGARPCGLAKGVRLRQWRGNEIQGAFPPLNNADQPSDQGRGATGSQRGRGGGEQGTAVTPPPPADGPQPHFPRV